MENKSSEKKSDAPAKSENTVHDRAFQVSSEPLIAGAQTGAASAANHDLSELDTLPQSYGVDTIYLIARDPEQLFCYWDVDFSKIDAANFHEGKWQISLRLFANGEVVSTNPTDPGLRHNYLPVSRGAATYAVELGYFDRAKKWAVIARSNEAQTPSSKVDESRGSADFATIPLHLDFQRLTEMVQTAVVEHLPLGVAFARLQSEGLRLAGQTVWNEEERALVARLLGVEMTRLAVLGSIEIDQWLREELQKRIHSEGASGGAFGGLSALVGGDSSSASGSLSSAFGGFGALGGLSSETLSSFGLSSAALTRFGLSSAALAQLGLSSSALAEFGLSSAALAQFGLSSAALSSFGLTSASLSSPFGSSWSEAAGRGFFMHVNAEVIFYGGTQPGSRVTIDGKEIALTANGTFSYHFKFPDGDFEMPIIATSPDGVETRSATLSFKRATARVGGVDATGQPAHLTDPRI